MAAKNDITGATLVSVSATPLYRDNYDRIFRAPKETPPPVAAPAAQEPILHPELEDLKQYLRTVNVDSKEFNLAELSTLVNRACSSPPNSVI